MAIPWGLPTWSWESCRCCKPRKYTRWSLCCSLVWFGLGFCLVWNTALLSNICSPNILSQSVTYIILFKVSFEHQCILVKPNLPVLSLFTAFCVLFGESLPTKDNLCFLLGSLCFQLLPLGYGRLKLISLWEEVEVKLSLFPYLYLIHTNYFLKNFSLWIGLAPLSKKSTDCALILTLFCSTYLSVDTALCLFVKTVLGFTWWSIG